MSEDSYLTPAQLVELWNGAVTEGTLSNWRAAGRGPTYYKIGGRVVYQMADIRQYEADNRVTPAKEKGQE